MTVGIRAPFRIPIGETSSLKYFFRIDWPAGLGALAIMVSPPPATAVVKPPVEQPPQATPPATTAPVVEEQPATAQPPAASATPTVSAPTGGDMQQKRQQLDRLLDDYANDKITAAEYHRLRSQIISGK